MDMHLGNRVKYLVENNYKGSKKDFAKDIGLKQDTYLFEIFKKEDLNTDVLKKVATVLKISLSSVFAELEGLSIVQEQTLEYGNKELEIKMLRKRVENLEEINEVLRDQVKVYKMMEQKKVKK